MPMSSQESSPNAPVVGTFRSWRLLAMLCVALAIACFAPRIVTAVPQPQQKLELSRAAHPSEFLCAVGQRSAVFGNETGTVEAWAYPLKLLRDFSLIFHVDDHDIPAAALARTIVVRPESTALVYVGDTFRVTETFVAPVHEPGVIIRLDVETEGPLEIEAVFRRDFQLEWPAGLGATWENWDEAQHAFVFGEEQKIYSAYVGSPTAVATLQELNTNYDTSEFSGFRLGVTASGKGSKLIVMAGSANGAAEAEATYKKLTAQAEALESESARYYRDYLQRTVSVELPDAEVQKAYDWSRVSVVQGLVANAKYGTGLIAGYRTSGDSQRPGFAWFFGRDAFWTSLALNGLGDFATTKIALTFVGKFQRDDGKIPHEISQAAGYVDWFKAFPYGFASADATPLYIIAMDDYERQSGDEEFIRENWERIWKAYQFLRSTWDLQGFPKNLGVGHGWVEGGRLLPVKTELYQTGLGTEALRALANLSRAAGKADLGSELDQLFAQQKSRMNDAFWLKEKGGFAFALDQDSRPVEELSVLTTVPMWFGLLDRDKTESTITQLSNFDHQTDWGMRIISGNSPKYSGEGYHYGSVWPLFTGWASVAEYRYHQAEPAYANLRANALLTFDGSLGHVTEVLSGSNYAPLSTSSPQQIWSAAMVVSPMLRGLFGLERDAAARALTLAPHVPADWTHFAIRDVSLGGSQIDFRYQKTAEEITLEVTRSGGGNFTLNFEPALSMRTKVQGVELNGHRVDCHVAANESDQHVRLHLWLTEKNNTIRIRVKNDFGITYHASLPTLGGASQGLRILSERWSGARDTLTVEVSGRPGVEYELAVWNPQEIRSVDGAKLVETERGAVARIQLEGTGTFVSGKIVFHF